jgi:NhaP-type Na+/H+ or K+/H+ antiporter
MSSVSETRAREYYNPKGGGGARCWGSAVAKDAERQYWWSWRGIHVDPNAPLTNEELGELKDALMEKNWSWGLGENANATRSDADADADAEAVVASSAKTKNKEKNRRDVWIDAAAMEWDVMAAPPAPPASDLGIRETTDLLIEAKSGRNDGEETVAGAAVASMLFVLMTTLILGSWLKKRRVHWLHQAGAALLLGVAGGVYMISQAIAQDMRSKDGLGGEKNWILTYGDYLVFDTEFFFLFLLPPIIFESGYAIDAEPFFRNIGKIAYFAFIGTFAGSFAFGIGIYVLGALGLAHPFGFVNAMLFGSIMGATDPVTVLAIFTDLRVDPDLFAVVFGESVLNDAVAVVLYRAIQVLEDAFTLRNVLRAVWAFAVVFLGSTAVGVAAALASALLFKRVKLSGEGAHVAHPEADVRQANDEPLTESLRPGAPASATETANTGARAADRARSFDARIKGATLEASVVVLFPWIAYMLAEALELVGIVSVLFCGIVMGHYTKRNLSDGGRALSSGAFALSAQLSETFVFIYCGASVFLAQPRFFVTAGWTVALAGASRALVVFPGAALINRHSRGDASARPTVSGSGESAAIVSDERDSSNTRELLVDKSHGLASVFGGFARFVVAATTRRGARVGPPGGSGTLWYERLVGAVFGGGAPIPENHARMLWFSGLRGAMAFALAMEAASRRGEDGRAMLTSTLGAVLFTVLVVGGLTVPALRRLGVECDVAVDRRVTGDVSRSPNPKRTTRQSGKTYDERADATAVLVRSNADDGPAAKRGGGRRDRSEGGKTFGSFDDAEGGGTYGIDVRETFRFVDRQYITPMFTLEENSRDAGNGDGNGNGGDGADSR